MGEYILVVLTRRNIGISCRERISEHFVHGEVNLKDIFFCLKVKTQDGCLCIKSSEIFLGAREDTGFTSYLIHFVDRVMGTQLYMLENSRCKMQLH